MSNNIPDLNKESLWKRILHSKRAYLLFAFLVPAFLMLAIYFAFLTYPFGGRSVLVLDLNAQYVYFFGALRRALTGDASLIYSFSRALGGEFIGIFAYYLASPLSFIVALFPAENILEALLFMFTLKCGLCGLSLAFYLDRHGIGTPQSRVIFGSLYALCGYGIIYQHNTMWIDCMLLLPIIAYGIEQLISKRRYLLFTLILAVAIFSNFYIGFMVCIFCFIYFFYAYFCVDTNPIAEKKHFFKSLVRMALFSAIAIALAACIILPTYYSLGFGKTTFSNPTYNYLPEFDLLDLVAKLFINSYDTVRPEGLPIIYCGIFTIMLLPMFFIDKKIQLREKVGTGVLIGIFILSFSIDAIDKFWHGMQAPNWLNYRYSFMFAFILIVAAAKAFVRVRHFTAAQIGTVVGGWFIVLLAVQKLCEFPETEIPHDLLTIYISALFFAVYAAVLGLFRNKTYRRAASSVLLIIVCAELGISSFISMHYLDEDVVYSSHSSYLNNISQYEPSTEYILENDEGFYRFDTTKHALIDTPMALGIRGFTNSTSTLNEETIEFLHDMGIASKSHWSKYFGATAPFDSLLGLKYVIVDGEYDVPPTYTEYFVDDDVTVYKNPDALSLAYAVSGDFKNVHFRYPKDYDNGVSTGEYEEFTAYYTPAQRINALVSAMLGKSEIDEIFVPISEYESWDSNVNYSFVSHHAKYTPINSDNAASLYYSLVSPVDGIVYMYLPTDYPRETNLTVCGVDKGTAIGNETDRMIALGSFEKDEEITVTLTLNEDRVYIRTDVPYFWYVDGDAYSKDFSALAENQFEITEWSDTKFTGTITTTAEKPSVFTSIPYDENWNVYVDGEKTEIYKSLEALVAFDTAPGTHSIKIVYVPRQLNFGLCISISAAILLIAITLIDRRRKKRSVPAVISADATFAETTETAAEPIDVSPAVTADEDEIHSEDAPTDKTTDKGEQ